MIIHLTTQTVIEPKQHPLIAAEKFNRWRRDNQPDFPKIGWPNHGHFWHCSRTWNARGHIPAYQIEIAVVLSFRDHTQCVHPGDLLYLGDRQRPPQPCLKGLKGYGKTFRRFTDGIPHTINGEKLLVVPEHLFALESTESDPSPEPMTYDHDSHYYQAVREWENRQRLTPEEQEAIIREWLKQEDDGPHHP